MTLTGTRARVHRVDDAAPVAGGALQPAPGRVGLRVGAAQLPLGAAAARAARHATRAARTSGHAALSRAARY